MIVACWIALLNVSQRHRQLDANTESAPKDGGKRGDEGGSDIPASKKSSTGEWLIAHRVATRSLVFSRRKRERERQIETLSRSLGWREHPLSNYALHSSNSYPIAPVVSAAMQLISRRYGDSVRSLVKLYLTGVLGVLDAQGAFESLIFLVLHRYIPPFFNL